MSLFKSVKKYEVESKKSVEVKKQLVVHEATYPKARASYEAGRSEVIRFTSELNAIREAEGNNSPAYAKLAVELSKAKARRDRPLQEYGAIKHDLELQLEQLNKFFIAEQLEIWREETKRVESERVHQELPKEKELPGEFSIGGGHRVLTNDIAVRLFQEKSLQNSNHLRDMTTSSIPEIQEFIEKAESEMRGIDFTPIVIELDARAFQNDLYESKKEPGRTVNGVLTVSGGLEVSQQVDPSGLRYDYVKASAADGLYGVAKEMVKIGKKIMKGET